ncbi:MAG: hypothetical protein H0V89_05570, partial [Deltaproteobacteria bacterium]|nr:hypothetical protein [Deltaproteobacteria bacterium]
MYASPPEPFPVITSALLVGRRRTLFDGLRDLVRGRAAIELAIAMQVAWLRRRDPADLGHLSFGSFTAERLDWGDTWRRALVALVESPLDLVKQAACEGLVPLRVAVRAARRVSVADQATWLIGAVIAPNHPVRVGGCELGEDDGDVLRRARRLARICLGRTASPGEVDNYLLSCWRDRLPAEVILAAARAAPPAPEPLPELSWAWCRDQAEPASTTDALRELERLQAVLRGRATVLAKAWSLITSEALWTDGFTSAEACANAVLGLSLRQAQRVARLGAALERHPEVESAIRRGLPVRYADRIVQAGGEGSVQEWIALAERVGRRELDCALDDVGAGSAGPILDAYREAIALATSAVGPDVRVALPHPEQPVAPLPVRATPELVQAARWWLDTVHLPPKCGFGRVKERDRYQCQ